MDHRDELNRKRSEGKYDVFLCHNDDDKQAVVAIAEQLLNFGILPWLDKWELVPGESWQDALDIQVGNIKVAVVFVGLNGIGPWEKQEVKDFVRKYVEGQCRIIPVLLPDAPTKPDLPARLRDLVYVDFRDQNSEPLQQLINGITGKRPDLPLPQAKRQATWTIPAAPEYFTGQEIYLGLIEQALAQTRLGGIFEAAALHGFGGTGKTALALKYAELHRGQYAGGYLISCEKENSLIGGLAQHCGQAVPPDAPPEVMLQAARMGIERIAGDGLSLVVLDNADDLIGSSAFFAEVLQGFRKQHVLITSRPSPLVERCKAVEIESLSEETGGLFFYRLWRREASAEWEKIGDADKATCREVSRELDGLPLALE